MADVAQGSAPQSDAAWLESMRGPDDSDPPTPAGAAPASASAPTVAQDPNAPGQADDVEFLERMRDPADRAAAYAETHKPPPPPPPKPTTAADVAYSGGLGFYRGGQVALTMLKLAGATPQMLVDNIHSIISGHQTTDQTDAWMSQIVEPQLKRDALLAQGPGQKPTDPIPQRVAAGVGNMLSVIAQAVLTGGPAAAGVEQGLTSQIGGTVVGRLAARGAAGATMMTAPAAAMAVDVGQKVYQQTNDQKAALTAASVTYLTGLASGAAPMSIGGGLATRVASGAAIGAGVGELSRRAENAALPVNMQSPFDLAESAVNALGGAAFGGLHTPDIRESKPNVMEEAQAAAARAALEAGGDNLDAVAAAAHANAELSAVHDAAAVHQARLEEQGLNVSPAAGTALSRKLQGQGVPADLAARRQQNMARQNAMAPQEPVDVPPLGEGPLEGEFPPPTPDAAFDSAPQAMRAGATEVEEAPQPAAAQPPPAEPEPAAAQPPPAEPEPAPTPEPELPEESSAPQQMRADLPEEHVDTPESVTKEVEVAQTLAERRAAEQAERERTEREAQNQKGQQDIDVAEARNRAAGLPPTLADALPPEQLSALAALRQKRLAENSAPPKDEPLTVKGEEPEEDQFQPLPPAVPSKKTLAERRQAAFDAAHAAKTRGEGEPAPEPVTHRLVDDQPVGTDEPETLPEPRASNEADEPAPEQSEEPAPSAAEEYTGPTEPPVEEPEPNPAPTTLADRRTARLAKQARRAAPFTDTPLFREGDPEVEHEADDVTGEHVASTDGGGEIHAQENGPYLQVKRSDVPPGLRGNGHASAIMERLHAEAQKRGLRLSSDVSVSPDARRVYEAMRRRGYPVTENPNEVSPTTGNQVSTDPRKPVYEVGPKRPNAAARVPPKRLTKREALPALQPVIDRVGADKLYVHDNADSPSVPEDVRQRLHDAAQRYGYDPNSIRGMYDPATDSVHLFANAHESAEDLRRTMVHEVVGHKGLRALLGDEFRGTMADIYGGIKDREWVKDFIAQHDLNPRDPEHQRIVAEEYAAHLAENPEQNPTILGRVIRAVRAGLRKLGLVRGWTDDDIRGLLRSSETNLKNASAPARAARAGSRDEPRFASNDDSRMFEHLPPDHPLSIANKIGSTVEGQANYGRGFVRARNNLTDAYARTHSAVLATIGLRNLPDFLPERVFPGPRAFVRLHDQMAGREGRLTKEGADLAKAWSQWTTKNKAEGGVLGELMHASTLLGQDPSKPFQPPYSTERLARDPQAAAIHRAQQAHYRVLKGHYDALPDQGKQLYNQVRDFYSQQRTDTLRALEARTNESNAPQGAKDKMTAALRLKFEQGRVAGPYFPLSRFGDYWAAAKDKETGDTVSFSRFESAADHKQWLADMRAKGFDVDGGKKDADKDLVARIDPEFAAKVTDLARDVDPKLADEIWQTYLKAMPEMSMRKHNIHRVGRLGYTMDALRGFQDNAFHGAKQVARLEYGHRLDNALQNIRDQARAIEQQDPTSSNAQWARAVSDEFKNRLDWINNPKGAPWASALTRFGFGWYLGAAPATAFRIFTQNPMLAQPQLARHFGELGASKQLGKASIEWAASLGKLKDKLRGDDRRAMDEAEDQGIFSSTNTQMLAQGGSGKQSFVGPMATMTKVAGYLFNGMEHHNRQTTFLAAYRLGRMQGMDHTAAVQRATDITWDSHFDYTNANRPRFLQSNAAKVMGLFKQYSLGVTYRLARDLKDSFRGDLTSEENNAARHAFASTMMRMMLFAGVSGITGYSAVTTILDHVLGDKDKPFDSAAALHTALNNHFGQAAGDAIMTGPVGALTGLSLSGGSGYNDLWYRSPARDETVTEQTADALGQFLGPIAAIPLNMAAGADMMAEGHTERGFEHFMPPEAAALMKAWRYYNEGVTTLKGDPVMSKDEVSAGDIARQMAGFTPQDIADRYAENTAMKNIAEKIQTREKFLNDQLEQALTNNDVEAIQKAGEELTAFHEKNPELPWSARGMFQSEKARARNEAQTVNGVRLPPGLEGLRSTYQTGAAP